MATEDRTGSGAPPDLHELRPATLAGLVSRIICYSAQGTAGAADREIASFTIPVIISFAAPFRIAFDRQPRPDEQIGSFISGLHPGFVEIGYGDAVSCVQIDLTPIGARLFFGWPLTEVATRLVPLEDVGDRGLSELRDRLGAAETVRQRLAIAAAFMEQRLLGRAAQPETIFVWAAIQQSRGTVRIDRLTQDLGWSRKRLAAHSRDAFGMTAKRLARVARFQNATGLAARAPRPDWAGIAFECGYSDQAHLVRDFNMFAGHTPERWHVYTQQAKQNASTAGAFPD